MKFSHLPVLAVASAVTAQDATPVNLRAAAGINFCLRPIQDPPSDGTPVQFAVCPSGTQPQWIIDPGAQHIESATNMTLCLGFVPTQRILEVNQCGATTALQAFIFDVSSNQIRVPRPIGIPPPPPRPDICVTIGSSIAPCNTTDPGQRWVATAT